MAGKGNAFADGKGAKAPVILLHGFAQTPASWDGIVRALQEQGRRTYALNLFEPESDLALRACDCREELTAPGDVVRDRADRPTGDPASHPTSHPIADPLASMGAVCDRVAAIVRLVAAVEGAPMLVGYSMGGRIAAETMVRHPGLPLAGLLLESAGLGPADEAARVALAERNGEWAARLRTEGVAAAVRHPARLAPGCPCRHPRRSRGPRRRNPRSLAGGLGCAPPGGGEGNCGCSRSDASCRSSSSLSSGVSRREVRCPRRPRSRCRFSCRACGGCRPQRSFGKARGIRKGHCAA